MFGVARLKFTNIHTANSQNTEFPIVSMSKFFNLSIFLNFQHSQSSVGTPDIFTLTHRLTLYALELHRSMNNV